VGTIANPPTDALTDVRIRLEGDLERVEVLSERLARAVRGLEADVPSALVQTVTLLEDPETARAIRAVERAAVATPSLRATMESLRSGEAALRRAIPRGLKRIRRPGSIPLLEAARRLDHEQLLFDERVIPRSLFILPASLVAIAALAWVFPIPLWVAAIPLPPALVTAVTALVSIQRVTLTTQRLLFNRRELDLSALRGVRVLSSLELATDGYNASRVELELTWEDGSSQAMRFPGAPAEFLAGLRRTGVPVS
jgi:hypothetical protein